MEILFVKMGRLFVNVPLILLCLSLFAASTEKGCPSPQAHKITREELKAMLGEPDLVLIDVRIGKSWSASDRKITGAVHEDPENVNGWAAKYSRDKKIVLYCA